MVVGIASGVMVGIVVYNTFSPYEIHPPIGAPPCIDLKTGGECNRDTNPHYATSSPWMICEESYSWYGTAVEGQCIPTVRLQLLQLEMGSAVVAFLVVFGALLISDREKD